jgi:hypothetical protein
MDTLVRTSADEINNSLIDFIKSSFKGKKIAVHIYEEDEVDETAYLLNDPQAKKRLLESVKNVKDSVNLKEYSIRDIENILNDDGE